MARAEGKKHPDPARARARRQQVLSAAETCFARSGFHGASMAEISKLAEMSPGHIYNYFQNKEAIIAAIAEQKIEGAFLQPDETVQSHMRRHITGSEKCGDTGIFFDILGESVRNPKMHEILQRLDIHVQKQFEDLCAKRTSLRGKELSLRVGVLRMFFTGIKAAKIAYPGLDEQATLAILDELIESLFKSPNPAS